MAKSLEILRAQINALSPNRDTSADGGIGNAEHSARISDHNPNTSGVVCARDFTHDPGHGIDSELLANKLLASRDARIKYVISNRKIASGDAGPKPWMWRDYPVPPNKNPHDHHFHISVKADPKYCDDDRPWKLDGLKVDPIKAGAAPVVADPLLRRGASGPSVAKLQQILKIKPEDGIFGLRTEAAVVRFQSANGIATDGIVGPYTWKKLKE